MNNTAATSRQTKYCTEIEDILRSIGHATNYQLHAALQKTYPDVSPTTVHRVTARLASRGVIAVAPAALDGSMRYDATVELHDHFICSNCGILRDTTIRDQLIPLIEQSIDDCKISGPLLVSGICKKCIKSIDGGVK